MSRPAALSVTLLLLAAGCGGGGEDEGRIPARQAAAMITQLDNIQGLVERGTCGGALAQVGELEEKVAALPRSVNPEVRDNLARSVRDLRTLAQNDCATEPEETTQETTTETTTAPTETEPTETEPEPTETETEPTEPTEPVETVPPPPPGNGGAGPPGQEQD